jgi:hypothetical protein
MHHGQVAIAEWNPGQYSPRAALGGFINQSTYGEIVDVLVKLFIDWQLWVVSPTSQRISEIVCRLAGTWRMCCVSTLLGTFWLIC